MYHSINSSEQQSKGSKKLIQISGDQIQANLQNHRPSFIQIILAQCFISIPTENNKKPKLKNRTTESNRKPRLKNRATENNRKPKVSNGALG